MFLHPVLEFMSLLVHLWPLSRPLVSQSRQGLEGCSTHQKGWGLGWMVLPQTSALLLGWGWGSWEALYLLYPFMLFFPVCFPTPRVLVPVLRKVAHIGKVSLQSQPWNRLT